MRRPRHPVRAGMLALASIAALPPAAAEPGFTGSAYQALRRVTAVEGEGRTLARQTFEALVDTCNQQRAAFYELPAVRPPDDVLAKLDEQRIEKYFELDRAATHVYGTALTLPHFETWTRALSSSGGKPDWAPNCAAAEPHEDHKATLWIDGRKYELNYVQRRARGLPAGGDFTVRTLVSARDFDTAPKNLIDGHACRELTGPAVEFLAGQACLWTEFPPVRWLNFPWALKAERRLGLPGKLVITDTLVAIERNRAIAPDMLRIPPGFEVKASGP